MVLRLFLPQHVCTDLRDRDVFTGRLFPTDITEYKYLPFEVSPGVTSIHISYNYTDRVNSTVDIGIFDERGYALEDGKNATTGFRGWSFNLLSNFTFTPSETTPNYAGGPISHGTWYVLLANTHIDGEYIDYEVKVEYGYQKVTSPRFSMEPAATDLGIDERRRARMDNATDGEIWLKGDFHVHTIYSDGSYTPAEQVAHAQQQGLDFYFSTEHNTHCGNDIMGSFAPEDMLIGRGMETVEWRYEPNSTEYSNAVEQVHRVGGFVSVNHSYMACKECIWNLDHDFKYNDAIEIWNGYYGGINYPAEINEAALSLWQRLLVQGQRVTGIGGSDSHDPPSMIGSPCTKVKARTLSTASIVEGVKRRRVYIVETPEMEIDFTIRGENLYAQIGDVVETTGAALTAYLSTVGFDGQTACFITESGYLVNETIHEGTPITLPVAGGVKFLRLEVRNSTGSYIGLTNPIYFE
ncbi:PHP domain-like protein [Thozetella sp. PMI_491]|nr:PHP domain-like protein [Thozetella sp. PMI_491]